MIKISYREKFAQSIKKQFAKETAAYQRREKAENLIFEYFGDLLDELYDETEAANERFDIEFEKIKLNGTELGFDFVNSTIEVYTADEGSGEKKIVDRIEDNGTVYSSKEQQKELSEDLLDYYLQQTFEGDL